MFSCWCLLGVYYKVCKRRLWSISMRVWYAPSWQQRYEGSTIWEGPQNVKYSFQLRNFLKIYIAAASLKKERMLYKTCFMLYCRLMNVESSSLRYSLSRSFAVELRFWGLIKRKIPGTGTEKFDTAVRFTETNYNNLAKFQLG